MSVWQPATAATLSGSAGTLVSISIDVDARYLESLLEALARVSFPVNPEIFHQAEMSYIYADGHQESEAVTLVDFPAYSSQLEEVRAALEAYGFDPARLRVSGMLEQLHAGGAGEPAPPGAAYVARYRHREKSAARTHQP